MQLLHKASTSKGRTPISFATSWLSWFTACASLIAIRNHTEIGFSLSFADDLFSDLPKDVKCGRMTIEEIASGLGK
jgi:hypothetical protein